MARKDAKLEVLSAPLLGGSLIEKEAHLERLASQMGAASHRERTQRLKESGQSHLLPPVQKLIASWDEPLAGLIREHNAARHKRGDFVLYGPIFDDLTPRRIAGVALTAAVSRLMRPQRFKPSHDSGWPQGCAWSSLAREVAMSVYAEWHTDLLKEQAWNDKDMMWLLRRRWKTLDARKINQWFKHNATNTVEMDEELLFSKMGGDLLWHMIGVCMFDDGKCAINVANLERRSNRLVKWVFFDTKVIEAIDDAGKKMALLRPMNLPMVVEPLKWGPKGRGGYHKNRIKLVSRCSSRQRELLEGTDDAEFWHGVNHIANTPMTINGRVAEVMNQAIDSGGDTLGIPRMDELPKLPRLPDELALNRLRLMEWIRAKRKINEDNINIRGPRRQMHTLSATAAMMDGFDKFWIPVKLDFRGRVYAGTSTLSYTADDPHRGLLMMGEWKEPGPRGEWWKLVNAANHFGHDKLTFEERAEWASDHVGHMVKAAEKGLDDDWWQQAKKPWQFFAACVSFVDEGVAGRIMAGVDGTCSGLQHYAAMGLDEVAGEMVNLIPSEKPNDAYLTVLRAIIPVVQKDVADGKMTKIVRRNKDGTERSVEYVDAAGVVLPLLTQAAGKARDFVKQPVMTYTYGVTRNGVRGQLKGRFVDGEMEAGLAGACSVYLTDVIMDQMRQSASKATQIMEWLQECARLISRRERTTRVGSTLEEASEQTMEWWSPSGFPVVQPYWRNKMHQVTTLAGVMNVFVPDESGKVVAKDAEDGIAPNLVHSYDAAMLHRAAALCGLGRVALVPRHDDFNSHLATMDTLNTIVRDAFVTIYRDNVLENLRTQFQAIAPVKLPDPPERGNLDIEQVSNSRYFCH